MDSTPVSLLGGSRALPILRLSADNTSPSILIGCATVAAVELEFTSESLGIC